MWYYKEESILEFPNGTLDLTTKEFQYRTKQCKNNVNSMQIAVKYEDKNEIKMKFLREKLINKMFKGEDERKVHLTYDAEMLYGSSYHEKMFYGPSSKQMMFNVAGIGKSLWTNLVGKVMGTYAARVHPSLIYEKTDTEETDWQSLKSV